MFIRYTHKPDNPPRRTNPQRIRQESLQESGVPFVGCGLEEVGEGGDGEDVGGVEGAAEEHAGGVIEVDEYAGGGALVALGEVLGEVLEEFVFVSDLLGRGGGQLCFTQAGFGVVGRGGRRTMTFVLTSTATTESLYMRSLGVMFGSR